jgi:hypothetical protein
MLVETSTASTSATLTSLRGVEPRFWAEAGKSGVAAKTSKAKTKARLR